MPRPKIVKMVDGAVVRYALYRRVSSEGQVDRDLSLPEQKAQQHEYVAREGGIIAAEYEDGGISGRTAAARPAFQEMIAAAKEHAFDVILVHKSDRAFRNGDEAATYRLLTAKIGVRWASVTEKFFGSPEPADKLLTGIMESVSEFFSDNLAVEVRKGIRSAAVSKGRQHGPPPYGYRYADLTHRGAGWVADEEEAPRVLYLYRYMDEHAPTLAALCQHVNALGWPRPSDPARGLRGRGLPGWHSTAGGGWTPVTMSRTLQSRVLLGEILCAGEWLPGHQLPLVPEDLARRVHAHLARRRPSRSAGEPSLFTGGLLRCPVCAENGYDSVLYVHKLPARPTRGSETLYGPYRTYFCSARLLTQQRARKAGGEAWVDAPGDWACPGFNLSEKKVFTLLSTALTHLGTGGEIWQPGAAVPSSPPAAPSAQGSAVLLKELAALPLMRDGYDDMLASRKIDAARYDANVARLAVREAALSEALAQITEPPKASAAVPPDVADYLLGIILADTLTLVQKQARVREHVLYLLPTADKKKILIVGHPR